MVAERLTFREQPQAQHHTLFLMFEQEKDVDEFVHNLTAIAIPAAVITILQVALDENTHQIKRGRNKAQLSPKFTRYTWYGAGGAGIFALLLGSILYTSQFLALSPLEAILIYFVALLILCMVLGAALGAVVAAYQAQEHISELPPEKIAGFLVTAKIPQALLERCEMLAQSLGAKTIQS